jgi:hypothetical protein
MSKARDIASAAPAPSTVSATELGYVDGVTSAIQTQLDAKAPSSTAVTLTGTQTLTNKTLTSPVLTTPTISTVDAKGDLLAATADNTVARLAVGANNTVLTADSAEATGLKWATPSSGGMTLLSTTTLSGATTTVSGIDQTYVNLFIIVTNVINNTANGAFRIGINGGTNSHDGVCTRFEQGGSATISGFANDYLLTPTSLDRTNGTNTFSILMPGY